MSYYPPPSFHFRVEFDLPGLGENDFRFRDVSGISSELETESVNIGGENRYVQELPVRTKYPNLVLKRGFLKDSALVEWCKGAIEDLNIAPITIWVSVLNEKHEPLHTFTFINAWPKKWEVSELNAQNSEILVETLDICYQYFKQN